MVAGSVDAANASAIFVPVAFSNAAMAVCVLRPPRASISPGEKPARSSRTCVGSMSAAVALAWGFGFCSATDACGATVNMAAVAINEVIMRENMLHQGASPVPLLQNGRLNGWLLDDRLRNGGLELLT